MKDVVIWTVRGDVHARSVQWAVRELGAAASVWIASDFPSLSSVSCSLGMDTGLGASLEQAGDRVDLRGTTFWRRRPGAYLLHPDLHPDDAAVAEKELVNFNGALQYGIDSVVGLAANTQEGSERARSKLLQLACSREAGLVAPETLVSNCPSSIREFCAARANDVIIKSFSCPTWVGDAGSYFAYAKTVSPQLLALDESLSAVPAIYQKKIDKAYEVRAFFAGNSCLAVRLDSQVFEKSMTDWRAVSSAMIPLSRIELPPSVHAACRRVMKSLGIVTGSFDLAVTPDGEYVFFEVNEQGQFMWLEDRLPDVPCLQMFSEFLISGDENFEWKEPERASVRFDSYVASGSWEVVEAQERKGSRQVEKRVPYFETEAI